MYIPLCLKSHHGCSRGQETYLEINEFFTEVLVKVLVLLLEVGLETRDAKVTLWTRKSKSLKKPMLVSHYALRLSC